MYYELLFIKHYNVIFSDINIYIVCKFMLILRFFFFNLCMLLEDDKLTICSGANSENLKILGGQAKY